MTDTFGKEPHEQHEGNPDDMPMTAGDAGGEPPSDFEFSDDHAAVSDHGEETDAATAATSEAAAPRRSLLPVLAVLAGLGVLGGGGAWLYLSNNSATPEMPALSISAQAPAPLVAAAPKPDDAEEIAPKMDSSAPLSPAQEAAAAQPQTAVQAAADAPPKPPVVMPSNQKMQPALLSPPAALAALPPPEKIEAEPLPAPTMAPVAAAPLAPAPMVVAPATVAAPLSGDQAKRVEALTQRVDAMQKSLDQVAQQLGHVSNMVAATAPSDATSKDVSARLDRLEQKLTGRAAAPAVVAPQVNAPSSELSMLPVDQSKDNEAVVAPTKKTVKKAAPVKKTVAKPAHKPVASETVGTSKWVLRAATPEQAWVAPSATSRELRPVRVGDTLPGVGRITAISLDGDNWTLRGTAGTLK